MYKTIALSKQQPTASSWRLFSWITCGSSSDVMTPPISAPSDLGKISVTKADLLGFIRDQYLDILTEARCPCSRKPMPCPSAVAQFESALKTETLDLEPLEMGLFGLKSAIETNRETIENKEKIRSFLTQLQGNLTATYSKKEIKDLTELINTSLNSL